MVWPVFGSVNSGRPVSQHRFAATDTAEQGDELRALDRVAVTAIGAESGLVGIDGFTSWNQK